MLYPYTLKYIPCYKFCQFHCLTNAHLTVILEEWSLRNTCLSGIISQVFGKLCCCCSLHSPTINQLTAAVSHQRGPLHSKEAHRPTCPFLRLRSWSGRQTSYFPCFGSLSCSLLKTKWELEYFSRGLRLGKDTKLSLLGSWLWLMGSLSLKPVASRIH